MTKNYIGGAVINSGPDLPLAADAPLGALFIKTGVSAGLYFYGFTPDQNPGVFGNQAQQAWQLVIDLTGGTFVEKVGDTMSGQLLISTGSTPELHLTSVSPSIRLTETDQALNAKEWRVQAEGATLQVQTLNDAFAAPVTMFDITRAGVARVLGNTVWHAGNDGSGSTLDADTLDGFQSTILPTISTVPVRDTLGNLAAVRFEQTSPDNENPVVSQVMVTSIDNLLRKSSIASFTSAVQAAATGTWSITATNATNAVNATNATNATNAVNATNATNSANVTVTADGANAGRNVLFAAGTSGNQPVRAAAALTYNPVTQQMTTNITGNSNSATVLQNIRTINGVPFNGSTNITLPLPYTITSGSLTVLSFTNSVSPSINNTANFNDVFPPGGKTMANLLLYFASMQRVWYDGVVDDKDTIRCEWTILGDRIRTYVQNNEQRAGGSFNYLAFWS